MIIAQQTFPVFMAKAFRTLEKIPSQMKRCSKRLHASGMYNLENPFINPYQFSSVVQNLHQDMPGSDSDSDSMEGEAEHEHNRALSKGREAVERSLRQQVVVNHFPLPAAGAQVRNPDSCRPQYSQSLHEHTMNSPYSPFASRLDWEVARWAKLRGPGSTAVSELLEIDGVRGELMTYCKKYNLQGVSE